MAVAGNHRIKNRIKTFLIKQFHYIRNFCLRSIKKVALLYISIRVSIWVTDTNACTANCISLTIIIYVLCQSSFSIRSLSHI